MQFVTKRASRGSIAIHIDVDMLSFSSSNPNITSHTAQQRYSEIQRRVDV